MNQALVGIIGGSGLYQMDALQDAKEHRIDTPYGAPSDVLVTGSVHGVPVAFLARHARGHRLAQVESAIHVDREDRIPLRWRDGLQGLTDLSQYPTGVVHQDADRRACNIDLCHQGLHGLWLRDVHNTRFAPATCFNAQLCSVGKLRCHNIQRPHTRTMGSQGLAYCPAKAVRRARHNRRLA